MDMRGSVSCSGTPQQIAGASTWDLWYQIGVRGLMHFKLRVIEVKIFENHCFKWLWERGKFTHKFKSTVVCEELLDLGGPVPSTFEMSSSAALRGIAHETAPWINVFQLVEGFWSHQYVQTVLTETPE